MGRIYAVILAGGIGSRMGNVEKPKQYLMLGSRPIIVHTVEKFALHPGIDEVLVLCPRQWMPYTQDILAKSLPGEVRTGAQAGRTETAAANTAPEGAVKAAPAAELPGIHPVTVLEGGATRNETIMNAVRYIEKAGELDEETIIVTHDAVRPFVTDRIIGDNIRFAKEYDACDTVVSATDTIVRSENGETISDIPDRRKMYQGQTPQTFHAKKLKEVYESLSSDEKAILTDACKIMVLKGLSVHLVEGEVSNIKITYPYDITVAKALIGLDAGSD